MDLLKESMDILLKNQSSYGSFVACPEFDTYRFSWIRDGSFIAHALDAAGEYGAAARFFTWVDEVINRYASKIEKIEKLLSNGETIEKSDFMFARFQLEGGEEEENGWGNFQLDAYGTWLWALAQHIKLTGDTDLLGRFEKSIDLSHRYIRCLWHYPNYDVWEENSDKIHTSTLACLYGGLDAIDEYRKSDEIRLTKNRIRTFIWTNCVEQGRFVKYIGTDEVDASLLWLAVPFGVAAVDDPVFKNTVKMIERDLLSGEGLHRYKKDTFYGGGEWILLSCWLGLYYAQTGDSKRAQDILRWVESHADPQGRLPEQVPEHMNDASFLRVWVERWGYSARPLLWSHAMYILLKKETEKLF